MAEGWPRVWAAASKGTVVLELKIGYVPGFPLLILNLPFVRHSNLFRRKAPPPTKKGVLVRPQEDDEVLVHSDVDMPPADNAAATLKPSPAPVKRSKSRSSRPPSRNRSPPNLSIFTFLNGVSPASASEGTDALHDHFTGVHRYLRNETNFVDRKRYTRCPKGSRMGLYKRLEEQDREASGESDENLEAQIELFNLADSVFSFFFPASVGVPTVAKFWGAVERILFVCFLFLTPLAYWVCFGVDN